MSVSLIVILTTTLVAWAQGGSDLECVGVTCGEDCYTCKRLGQISATVTKFENKINNPKLRSKGEKGNIGPPGPLGERGRRGHKGDDGATGPQGPMGPRGEKGNRGIRGEAGAPGNTGPTGVTGPEGRKGERGPVGAKGERGDRGVTGPKGEPGLSGNTDTSLAECKDAVEMAVLLNEKLESLEMRYQALQRRVDGPTEMIPDTLGPVLSGSGCPTTSGDGEDPMC